MTRPLRIAFVSYRGNMNCGGQGVYLWFLTRELARLGIEVDVFVGPPYPDPMPFAKSVQELPNRQFWGRWYSRDYAGIVGDSPRAALSPLNFYEMASSRLGFLPEPFAFSVRAFQALASRIRAGRAWDVVHDVQCLGFGLLGAQAAGVPLVTTIHHPLTVDRRASFIRDNSLREAVGTMKFYPIGMQAFVARRLDRVLTSSEASAAQIVRDFGVNPERVTNVWNGIDTDLFCPDPNVQRKTNEILCVGRANDPNKGIRTLLEALARMPDTTRLSLVDMDGADNPAFQWARELGVANRFTVLGRISTPALVQEYRRATLVIVPSRYEGFGLPAVEAMACGTPVIASDAGALTEVIHITEGGILVPRDDATALAKAAATLLEQPELRARLGSQGRRRVVSKLSWPRIAQATAQVYAEVLSERRGRPAKTMTSAHEGTLPATQSRP